MRMVLFGSPPQAWGQRAVCRRFAVSGTVHPHKRGDSQNMSVNAVKMVRFTPTSVGTAASIGTAATAATVHPHKRGDSHPRPTREPGSYGSPPQAWGQHTPTQAETNYTSGSPPQAWGQLSEPAAPAAAGRFTPTSVGTARVLTGGICTTTVHPHKRGDS